MFKNKFKFLTLLIAIFVFTFVFTARFADVSAASGTVDLHKETRIYSKSESSYYSGCEDFNYYRGDAAEITVLIHGYSCSYINWSNRADVDDGHTFIYNPDSIVEKMYKVLDGEMTLYVAQGKKVKNGYSSDLYKYSYNDYYAGNGGHLTARIDDVSKHIVIVYDSCVADDSNYTVYEEFDDVMDEISKQYKDIVGRLPRFNIVTHSRGGMVGIQYATYHPYNVVKMYTMGSPFSGSVLGTSELIMSFMDYTDNKYEYVDDGVKSIMDESVSIAIRDAWNRNYKKDADLEVTTFGSASSFSEIRAMIKDIENNPEKYTDPDPDEEGYYEIIEDKIFIINILLNVIENNPELIKGTLDFAEGLADGLISFHDWLSGITKSDFDLFDYYVSKISPDLVGKESYEELKQILALVTIVDDELVVMDDLFIDTESQLGRGFSDGGSYVGFKRIVKIFTEDDISENRAIAMQPAIVHNLENLNADFIDEIVNKTEFGVNQCSITSISENSTINYNSKVKAVNFYADYAGQRKITYSASKISVYSYDAYGCLSLVDEVSGTSNVYKLNGNTKYLFVLESDTRVSNYVSIAISNKIYFGNNNITLEGNEISKCLINYSKTGYYIIDVGTNIEIINANKISSTKYYIYIKANQNTYIVLKNTSASKVTKILSLNEPNNHTIGQNNTISALTRVTKVTNDSDVAVPYKLTMTWSGTSSSKTASILNSNNQNISRIISSRTNNIYTFTLEAGESCYIIYNTTGFTANLIVNPEQYRWKIDGVLYNTNEVILAKGKTYNINLAILNNNGTISDYVDNIYCGNLSYCNFTNGRLEIYSNANVGENIILEPRYTLADSLYITIGYNGDFKWKLTNDDKVELDFSILGNFEEVSLIITNSKGTKNVYVTPFDLPTSRKFDITSYLNSYSSDISVSLNYIICRGKKFTNGIFGLSLSTLKVPSLYASGNGTSSSPYLITCYRHLNNIRYSISSYFNLLNDIDLNNKQWTPIYRFYGTIYGNGKTISNFHIDVSQNGGDYGFVNYLYGRLDSIRFSNVTMKTVNLSSSSVIMYIGTIAGCCYSGATIYNCDVKGNSTIDVQIYNAYIGGLVGKNHGKIDLSYYMGSDMTVSGKASGGIVGINYGTISRCRHSSGNITYVYKDGNSSVGGIVGENCSDALLTNCYSYGMMYWNSPKDDKNILPCLGKLIGKNSGTYSSCGSGMGYSYHYYYWHFIGWYDQSDRCFKKDNGLVGY